MPTDSLPYHSRQKFYLTKVNASRAASARYAALGVGQCRGALVSTTRF